MSNLSPALAAEADSILRSSQSAEIARDRILALLERELSDCHSPATWITSKDGDDWPQVGSKYLVRFKGVLQEEVYEFDQGDDGLGGGEYFWSHEDIDECPAFDPQSDEWLPLAALGSVSANHIHNTHPQDDSNKSGTALSEVPESTLDDVELDKLMSERDYWEQKATELAMMVGDHFGIELGEHTSANCPVQNAMEAIWERPEVADSGKLKREHDQALEEQDRLRKALGESDTLVTTYRENLEKVELERDAWKRISDQYKREAYAAAAQAVRLREATEIAQAGEPWAWGWVYRGRHVTVDRDHAHKLKEDGVDVVPLTPAMPEEFEAVKDVIDEYGGWWYTCSGCHDSVDGHSVGEYPFSQHLNCKLGSGCNECGGLGAVWTPGDLNATPVGDA